MQHVTASLCKRRHTPMPSHQLLWGWNLLCVTRQPHNTSKSPISSVPERYFYLQSALHSGCCCCWDLPTCALHPHTIVAWSSSTLCSECVLHGVSLTGVGHTKSQTRTCASTAHKVQSRHHTPLLESSNQHLHSGNEVIIQATGLATEPSTLHKVHTAATAAAAAAVCVVGARGHGGGEGQAGADQVRKKDITRS